MNPTSQATLFNPLPQGSQKLNSLITSSTLQTQKNDENLICEMSEKLIQDKNAENKMKTIQQISSATRITRNRMIPNLLFLLLQQHGVSLDSTIITLLADHYSQSHVADNQQLKLKFLRICLAKLRCQSKEIILLSCQVLIQLWDDEVEQDAINLNFSLEKNFHGGWSSQLRERFIEVIVIYAIRSSNSAKLENSLEFLLREAQYASYNIKILILKSLLRFSCQLNQDTILKLIQCYFLRRIAYMQPQNQNQLMKLVLQINEIHTVARTELAFLVIQELNNSVYIIKEDMSILDKTILILGKIIKDQESLTRLINNSKKIAGKMLEALINDETHLRGELSSLCLSFLQFMPEQEGKRQEIIKVFSDYQLFAHLHSFLSYCLEKMVLNPRYIRQFLDISKLLRQNEHYFLPTFPVTSQLSKIKGLIQRMLQEIWMEKQPELYTQLYSEYQEISNKLILHLRHYVHQGVSEDDLTNSIQAQLKRQKCWLFLLRNKRRFNSQVFTHRSPENLWLSHFTCRLFQSAFKPNLLRSYPLQNIRSFKEIEGLPIIIILMRTTADCNIAFIYSEWEDQTKAFLLFLNSNIFYRLKGGRSAYYADEKYLKIGNGDLLIQNGTTLTSSFGTAASSFSTISQQRKTIGLSKSSPHTVMLTCLDIFSVEVQQFEQE